MHHSLPLERGIVARERAIAVYAESWLGQVRTTDPAERERSRQRVRSRLRAELERQLQAQGYWVPFGPARMVVARKLGG